MRITTAYTHIQVREDLYFAKAKRLHVIRSTLRKARCPEYVSGHRNYRPQDYRPQDLEYYIQSDAGRNRCY